MPAMPPGRRRAAAAAGRAILFAAAALALCVCCDGGSEEGRSPRQRGGWAQAAQELLARPGAPPTLAEANLTVAGAVYGVDDSGVPNGAPSEAALEAPQAQNCSYADKQV
ncbi:hypothetical protein T484DRAFT_1830544 [Baffinella frigidus]|nr:hypothetical protein T484DRAFT_1830544 [Cryptophyta sp. CCMP2293]